MIKMLDKISRKHYIQCGLTVLLTFIVLYFTSALWYGRGVLISFNSQLQKDIEYQVFYTESDDQRFNELQSVIKQVKAGNQTVEILLPTENIVKFRIDSGFKPGEVVISDLKIVGLHEIEPDYNEFEPINMDKYISENNKLYIVSTQADPYIIYKKDLHLSAGIQIDWYRLIIISVLTFLLMYKFVQYLSKFKVEKQYSRIDIVMLSVFFALLFVPMMHISDAEKSEQENRMLAKKPQLIIDGGGYGNYGVQFDAWYNDHFMGRDTILSLYRKGVNLLASDNGNEKVLMGKNKWVFWKKDNSIENYANKTVLSIEDMKRGLDYLKAIDSWCKEHHKKFYYFIAPDKNRIYGEYYPNYIRKIRSDEFSIGHQFVKYIRENSDIKVIYPYDEFIASKKEGLLYYKGGTHWNYLGAYYGYRELLKVMQKDLQLPEVKILRWDNEKSASDQGLYNMISQKDIEKKYAFPVFHSTVRCQSQAKYNRETGEISCINSTGQYNAMVLRDSFFILLSTYITNSFHKTLLLWKYNLEKVDLENIEHNYDVLILENVERFIPNILRQKLP